MRQSGPAPAQPGEAAAEWESRVRREAGAAVGAAEAVQPAPADAPKGAAAHAVGPQPEAAPAAWELQEVAAAVVAPDASPVVAAAGAAQAV